MSRLNTQVPVMLVRNNQVIYNPKNVQYRAQTAPDLPAPPMQGINNQREFYTRMPINNMQPNYPVQAAPSQSVPIQTDMRQHQTSHSTVVPWPTTPSTNLYVSPNMQQVPQANVTREYAITDNGQQMITITPEEALALMAEYHAKGQNLPTTITQIPQISNNMMPNQQEPQYATPLNTIGNIKEFEHYFRNGVRYFYWPRNLKNDIIQWLRRIEETHGTDISLMIAKRLEIEYIPKEAWQERSKPPVNPNPIPPSQAQINSSPMPQQLRYPANTINTLVHHNPVETIIAPPHKPQALNVEDPNYWQRFKYETANNPIESPVQQPVDPNRPTTGLFVMQPKTPEEIEAEEMKKMNSNVLMGYPGTAGVDTARFKEYMPRIKRMVEQRFSDFTLSNDGERQAFQLSHDIGKFIADDVKKIMNDDGKGLVVSAVRTVDHQNKDCYVVQATNYKSPLFQVTLYPHTEQVDQSISQDMQQPTQPSQPKEDPLKIPESELISFFERALKKFDSTRYETADMVKKGVIAYLGTALHSAFKDKITVARAINEATAYVKNAVNIEDMQTKKSNETQQPAQQQIVSAAL